MDRNALRALQEPLKQRYHDDPGSAVVTLGAGTRGEGEGVTCAVQTGRALAQAGLHPASGGTGMEACSGDLRLEALAVGVGAGAGAGVTLRAVATSLDIPLQAARSRRGATSTSGARSPSRKEAPVGFRAIRLRFLLDAPQATTQ